MTGLGNDPGPTDMKSLRVGAGTPAELELGAQPRPCLPAGAAPDAGPGAPCTPGSPARGVGGAAFRARG